MSENVSTGGGASGRDVEAGRNFTGRDAQHVNVYSSSDNPVNLGEVRRRLEYLSTVITGDPNMDRPSIREELRRTAQQVEAAERQQERLQQALDNMLLRLDQMERELTTMRRQINELIKERNKTPWIHYATFIALIVLIVMVAGLV